MLRVALEIGTPRREIMALCSASGLENDVGEINIPREEQDALQAINASRLDKLIEQCLEYRQASGLRALQLERCGTYVASQLRRFEQELAAYDAAKAARKLAEKERDARRAGSDLSFAVRQMKFRVEQEQIESQRFYVDDMIIPPSRFSENLSVRVGYRWRPTNNDDWLYGSITFTHDVGLRRDYTLPPPKRKPNAAKQERERQDKLFCTWDHLKQLGLCSVRDFFRSGGDAASIPKTFRAKVDSHDQHLNNFSAQFWSERS